MYIYMRLYIYVYMYVCIYVYVYMCIYMNIDSTHTLPAIVIAAAPRCMQLCV